jgi:hypothetical protein
MINFGLTLFKARPNPSSDRHHCQATNRLGQAFRKPFSSWHTYLLRWICA